MKVGDKVRLLWRGYQGIAATIGNERVREVERIGTIEYIANLPHVRLNIDNPRRHDGLWILCIGEYEMVENEKLRCRHGVPYPAEGPNGPWTCEPDGSNPNCGECEPDAWKREEAM